MVSILGGAAGGATISIIIKAIDQYSKEFNKVDKNIKKQETIFTKLGKTLSKVGVGYAAVAGAAFALGVQAVKAALESERAVQQFNLALGDLADTMLVDLRRASKGMISDFNLIDNANRALALGISKNQLPDLMAAATARSKVFGRTVTEAFNDITIGVGRQSRLILDNLGIILDLDKTYKTYAESINKTTEALSESEKKTALVTAIIKDTQPLLIAQAFLFETNTEKLQKLNAKWDNAKEKIGAAILAMIDFGSASATARIEMERIIDTATGIEGTFDKTAETIFNLGAEMKNANDNVTQLKMSLLDLKDVVFEGERQTNLEIVTTKKRINELEKEINLRERLGEEYSFSGGVSTGDLKRELEDQQYILGQQRLDQEMFSLEKEEQMAQNAVSLENIGELEATTAEKSKTDSLDKIQQIIDERENIKLLTDKQIELLKTIEDTGLVADAAYNDLKKAVYGEEKKDIQDLIDKTNELIVAYGQAASAKAGGSSGGGLKHGKLSNIPFYDWIVRDAIITKKGEVVKTHPDDNIIATKGGMGGTTIMIEGNNIYGTDADDIATALQNKLSDIIA